MYNRYIPQGDGSFQRSRLPEKSRPAPQARRPQSSPPCSTPSCPPVCPPKPCREEPEHPQSPSGIGKFLRSLLPRDFDAEDLMVIFLLLLMSRDKEDQNSALLTLALYLFL